VGEQQTLQEQIQQFLQVQQAQQARIQEQLALHLQQQQQNTQAQLLQFFQVAQPQQQGQGLPPGGTPQQPQQIVNNSQSSTETARSLFLGPEAGTQDTAEKQGTANSASPTLIIDTPPRKEGVELRKEALRKVIDDKKQDLGIPTLEESSRSARNRAGAKVKNQRLAPYPQDDKLLIKEKSLHTAPQDAWDPAATTPNTSNPPTPSTPGDGLDLGGRVKELPSIPETPAIPNRAGITGLIQSLEKGTTPDDMTGEDL